MNVVLSQVRSDSADLASCPRENASLDRILTERIFAVSLKINNFVILLFTIAMSKLYNHIKALLTGFIIFIMPFCAESCSNRQTLSVLDDVESYIQERPDSALSVLAGLNRELLNNSKFRAKFSLLYSTALDKNYIDTTDLSIIQPAVDFYAINGSAVEKMKTFYYQGCIHMNRGEDDKAMSCYLLALEDSAIVSDNRYKELINSAISILFSRNHNAEQELVYTEDALNYGRLAQDNIGVWAILGHLASCYANCRRWEDAERTYNEYFQMPIYDSISYGYRCICYAKDILRCPEAQPSRSIDIISEVLKSFPSSMTIEGYCIYAYACQMLGEDSIANGILKQVEGLNEQQDLVKLWRYRIRREQGQYKQALEDLEESVLVQDSVVLSSLRQSLVLSQRDYLQAETMLLKKEHELDKLHIAIIVLFAIIAVAILSALYSKKKSALAKKTEELANLHYESRQMLDLQNVQTASINSLLAERDAALLKLRKQYASLFKAQYKSLNDLCSAYLSPIKKDRRDVLYDEVMRQLDIIVNDKESQNKFMSMVNGSLDNIIDKLRLDLPGHKELDFRFLMYVIAGFDAKTISNLTGYSVGTVYTKKNRLKTEISRLSSNNRDFYLEYID